MFKIKHETDPSPFRPFPLPFLEAFMDEFRPPGLILWQNVGFLK